MLFRPIDYIGSGFLEANDIRIFVQTYLPALLPYPDRVYHILIETFIGVAARSLGDNENSNLQFGDFLFLIWPQYKFRKATKSILKSRQSGIYEDR